MRHVPGMIISSQSNKYAYILHIDGVRYINYLSINTQLCYSAIYNIIFKNTFHIITDIFI